MADYQVIGDKQELGTKAEPSPSSTAPTGANYQITGDRVELGKTAVASAPQAKPTGTYQLMGDRVEMSRAPVKTVGNSSALPFSEAAKRASGS